MLLILTALASTSIFYLLTFKAGFSFVIDDFIFLVASYRADFNIKHFSYIATQRPLAAFLNYWTFKAHLFERSQILYYIYFFIHTIGTLFIFQWVVERFGSEDLNQRKTSFLVLTLGGLLALYPSYHQVLYIAVDEPYVLGLLLLGFSLRTRSAGLKTLLLISSFLFSETYIPASFSLIAASVFICREKGGLKHYLAWYPLLLWLIAVLGYFTVQFLMTFWTGPVQYHSTLTFSRILEQASLYWKLLWTLNFYKENWVLSAFEWLSVATAASYLLTRKKMKFSTLCFLLGIPVLAAAHSVIIDYYAPRAIHGAMVLKEAVIGLIVGEALVTFNGSNRLNRRIYQAALIGLVAIAYLGQTYYVMAIKRENTATLNQLESSVLTTLRLCQEPCNFDLRHPHFKFKNDPTLTPFFYPSFVSWVMLKNNINKQITVETPPRE